MVDATPMAVPEGTTLYSGVMTCGRTCLVLSCAILCCLVVVLCCLVLSCLVSFLCCLILPYVVLCCLILSVL
jgi:hypothetical protein